MLQAGPLCLKLVLFRANTNDCGGLYYFMYLEVSHTSDGAAALLHNGHAHVGQENCADDLKHTNKDILCITIDEVLSDQRQCENRQRPWTHKTHKTQKNVRAA